MKGVAEIWKDILGYEELYQGSNLGRIRGMRYGKIKILKQFKEKSNYLRVKLYKDGKKKQFFVHRLVWEAFNGEIPEGYEINHIDENPLNNQLYNLNLLTHTQNMNWGTRNKRIGEKNINGKRSKCVYQYTLDGTLVKEWPSISEAGRNGFSRSAIYRCCMGKKRQYKGFLWSYIKL